MYYVILNNMKMDEIHRYELQSHNLWWIRQELIHEDSKIIEFEQERYKWWPPFYWDFPVNEDAILTLRGPRQVGKTTLMKLLIRRLLLEDKIPREGVFYYPCDRIKDYNELFYLLTEYIDFAKARVDSRIYIFLDEISFVKEWQRALKEMADSGRLRNIILLLTGSNILDVKFSSERLPGRRGQIFNPDITILPLEFSEFLKLVRPDLKQKKHTEIFTLHFAELKKLFEDFLITGGFLMNINNFYSRGFIPAYIYELYGSWIEGDLHKTGKSDEIALRIFERLNLHLTTPVSFYKIAKESGVVSHITIRDYLDILEKMFVLFKTDFFSIEQKRPDFKKNHKIYFFDPFILQVVLAKMEGFLDDAFNFSKRAFLREEFRPKIAEMLVGAALKREYFQLYYGNSFLGEIDFVGKARGTNSFYEVKYQRGLEIKGFYKFKKVLDHLTVVTRDDFEDKDGITFLPLEIFLAFKEDFITPGSSF